MDKVTRSKTAQYVISPSLDFLLLGGASLVFLPLGMYLFPTESLVTFRILPLFMLVLLCLEYVANFPHFAYSYQLMYQDFSRKIKGMIDPPLRYRYILAGIIVPAAMVVFFIFGYLQSSTMLVRHAVNAMLLTAGWHYAKQGFGILIVTSVYQKIFYSLGERRILLFNAHLLWIYAWIMFNTGSKEKGYYGITFSTLGFPPVMESALACLVGLSTTVLLLVFFRKYRKEAVLPPLNGATAYIASVYLWIILRFGLGFDNPVHPIILLIPFMHSVQYIAIVLRMKNNEMTGGRISKTAFAIFIIFGVVIGAVIFDIIPRVLDHNLPYNKSVYGATLFLFMFWIFINIHHYFIDNVIWRREGSEAKNYLFSPVKG